MTNPVEKVILTEQLILLGSVAKTKIEAIRIVGQLLVDAQCVTNDFVGSMEAREKIANTYLGSGVAIPHGLVGDKADIKQDAIAVLQIPDGIEWHDGQIVKLVIAIAVKGDDHIAMLKRLTRMLPNQSLMEELCATTDPQRFIQVFMDAPVPELKAKNYQVKDLSHSFEWEIDYPSGLHARPSSAWADSAKQLGLSIQVRHGDDIAMADNMVELLQLGLKCGDVAVISADGENARIGLEAFKKSIIAISLREKSDAEHVKVQKAKHKIQGWKPAEMFDIAILHGVSASPGFVIAQSYHLTSTCPVVLDNPEPLEDAGKTLDRAIHQAKQQIASLIQNTTDRLGVHNTQIFKTQLSFLKDSTLISTACQLIAEGHGVAWSWHQAIEQRAKEMTLSDNRTLSERATDLRDIGYRVLSYIDPSLKWNTLADLPDGEWIITATDLSPSDTVLLDEKKVKGLITIFGGPTSHTAILARTLGIPAIVAAGEAVSHVQNGSTMILDGDAAMVYVHPSEANLASAHEWMAIQERKYEEEETHRRQPAITTDGHSITISANVNKPDQVAFALSQGAEGIGLMRTEFLFIERTSLPSEKEQQLVYQAMLDGLDGLPIIIRTLDIGGDKQVAHLRLPHENNPFLGVRGSRLLLRRMDLLLPQLKAIYSVAKTGKALSIMFPMITSATEILTLKSYCESVRLSMQAPIIPIGIMVEVPAAAVMADILAEHVDFFSIGTNDLAQYVLAVDRQNPELAAEADSLHPAVLRLIQQTVAGAKKYHRHVGVCGGLAGDPVGAMLLMGLGVDELSMTPRDIAHVKAKLRTHSFEQMKELAELAIKKDSSTDVRILMGDIQ